MFDRTFHPTKPATTCSTSGVRWLSLFYPAETPRPDTGALLVEVGMPSHAIRTFVPSQAGIGLTAEESLRRAWRR